MKKTVRTVATIRFAGDSSDGMQLTGGQFANTSGSMGNSVNSFPDYPSEIRAPEGTLYGVSAYQLQIGSIPVNTPGNFIDVLVAMNASSLKVNLGQLAENAIIIANTEGFGAKNLQLAKYAENPLENDSLKKYRLMKIDMVEESKKVLQGTDLSIKDMARCKNFFALGVVYWLLDRDMQYTEKWLNQKFAKKQKYLNANLLAMKAGYEYAKNSDEFDEQFIVEKADLPKGKYRNITGNEAVAIGLVAAANKASLPLFLGSYPITPATEILHFISGYKKYGVKHLQAEDEIAGISSAIGASFGGYLAATTTSGPGLSLKVEAIGLALILELPLVIVDVQRGGPSTGLPTKPEQADLLMAMYGRHGEAPVPIVAARSASHCFDMTIEAARIALKYMTPVILLTDGYLAQGTNPWHIPDINDLPDISVKFETNPENFQPYSRNPETLARPWAIPGTQGLEHRIGGLEKENLTGLVSQDPENHQLMVNLRAKKVAGIANDITDAVVNGPQEGDLLIVGWGGTHGAILDAFNQLRSEGKEVSFCHLDYLNPFPKNLGEILNRFKRILIPELNSGSLGTLFRSTYMKPSIGLNKIQGKPLKEVEVYSKVIELLNDKEIVAI